jgi:two-component system sensor histidine kinase/response regulator
MDGYETTRRIRSDPKQGAIPIIAMTAHAMAKERAMCLDAGMNDFITKPFVPHDLFCVLVKWMPGASPPDDPAAGDAEPTPPGGVSIDVGLARCMGRADLYARLAERFLTAFGDLPAQVLAELAAREPESAARLAHTLIAAAGVLGAVRLADLSRQLEGAIHEGSHQAAMALASGLEIEHQVVCAALTAHLAARGQSRSALRSEISET